MRTLIDRFWPKVRKSEGCWEWVAAHDGNGYGTVWANARAQRAHRVSYELANGPIPAGLFVCHRCDNPPCVRPDHLYLGTNQDNIRDAAAKGLMGHQRPRTHCRRGHIFTAATIAYERGPDGSVVRRCRVCKNRRQADTRRKARSFDWTRL